MLLSAAEKDSGILPGPRPRNVRINLTAVAANRARNKWRRHQLGDSYVPIDQAGFSFANTDISQPVNFDQYSVASSVPTIAPISVTAPDLSFDASSIQLAPLPDLSTAAPGTTYTPDYTQPGYVPSLPDIPTPSLTVTPQAPATPVPQNANPATGSTGGTDWLTNALKLATVAGSTYVGVTAAQRGLVPGVTPGTFVSASLPVPGVSAAGILPGLAIGAARLTPAQLATLTPAQRVQYATLYPGTGAASPTDYVASLFSGSSSSSSILLWGGVGLLAFVLLSRRGKNA